MSELNKKSIEDLTLLVREKREELRVFRFDLAGTSKKNNRKVSLVRKEIARALTHINARKRVTA
jgi:ribosomal protein L29